MMQFELSASDSNLIKQNLTMRIAACTAEMKLMKQFKSSNDFMVENPESLIQNN